MFPLRSKIAHLARGVMPFAFVLLVIEFLDELVFGIEEAAWPLIRADLDLSYAQIGLLLSLPGLVGSLVEPALGELGDLGWRRALVLGGGLLFALACLLSGLAPDFVVLLAAFALFYPSSGAFVGLAQATLMDADPGRHEQSMARWTLAGSLGVVAGPLLLGAAVWSGFGWRGAFVAAAASALALTALTARHRFPGPQEHGSPSLLAGLRTAWRVLRRPDVLRWLILLEFSDFMLDVLLGFLALYFVDVAGATPEQGALAVAVWTGVGLVGDALLIPLLERVRGLAYLRVSAGVMLVLYPAFLLTPGYPLKLAWLALMGLFNAGWYAILKGRFYSSLPGRSGTAMAVDSLFGLAAKLLPALLGLAAQQFGLPAMMWILLLGPIALLTGLPREGTRRNG
jgi:FSR family fosmidomycin resistance protein-like MFS transporter